MSRNAERIQAGLIVSTGRGFYKIIREHVSGAIVVYLDYDESGDLLTESGGECLLTWAELRRDLNSGYVWFAGIQ